ncbi:MAG: carbamoyl-phosphate synthase large subunit [Phycisphaerales bacterium]|nr:MAG: carbamoyl-phosphate synthase large subunit [Phycisphaerales bacterium]
MPRRDDLHTILILGSGPIVIGQGCEFDYSGTQACKALREEGYRVVLVNSNPATIMTDPDFSDRTYIEPITPEAVCKIIEREKELGTPIDALLPTIGGQTALNCACALHDEGTLEKYGIEMIGARREAIDRAENRDQFRKVVEAAGLRQPRAATVTNMDEASAFLDQVGLPVIIRPAFTLGGFGGGIAYNLDEFEDTVRRGLKASMIGQIQIDESVLGWKEYELEVIRDKNDNGIVVCGIENIDPMGVHTGDSITVAPIMTLTDKEYQRMRDAALKILRAVGVETGGSNVQFAVNPDDGEMVVIEMNPRVSRSSALASKATGFPIAKIATKLAVGYTLDELRNDITGTTSACFEPSIDYVVVKMPRWTFEKFPEADETLTTQMKSVGEAMSIGRTFKEAMQKAIRSMEVKRFGFGLDKNDKWLAGIRQLAMGNWQLEGEDSVVAEATETAWPIPEEKLIRKLTVPSQGRLYYVRYAFKMGWSIERVHELTNIDPWFLDQFLQLVEFEDVLCSYRTLEEVPREVLFRAKQMGYSDPQLANLYFGDITTDTILRVRAHRKSLGIEPVYKLVDTCAAEFEALTPYYYSTYETAHIAPGLPGGTEPPSTGADSASIPAKTGAHCDDEIRVTPREKIIILGGGPNRIGQGIEFDYCCVQASFAAKELDYESVMINSNPETVSTDYDTSDLLFFEPLTLEDTLNIIERLNGGGVEKPDRSGGVVGVIVQFGGQTPLNLAHGLVAAGVPLIGTGLKSIDGAEDRDHFKAMLEELNLKQPENGIARSLDEAVAIAGRIGYPVLVRPSYVLGGRGMETCFDETALRRYMRDAVDVSELANAPVLIDRFLSEAIEVDVDVIADFTPHVDTAPKQINVTSAEPRALVCGVMEHIEEAGVHSGDSSCTIPPYSLSKSIVNRIKTQARALAERLHVRGLMNVQMAVKDDEIYIIEVNPRASRTVPFVAKAKGVPWARIAAKVMMGQSLADLRVEEVPDAGFFAVKEPVFPFNRFPGVDVILGPEMRSTGEVMGAHRALPVALAKAQMAAGIDLPVEGNVFLSVRDSDKPHMPEIARQLVSMGFTVYTTAGTHEMLAQHSIDSKPLRKISEGARPNILDKISNGEIQLILNTATRKGAATDEGRIRAMAVRAGVPMITTIAGARAAVQAIAALRSGAWSVAAIQDYFPELTRETNVQPRPVNGTSPPLAVSR